MNRLEKYFESEEKSYYDSKDIMWYIHGKQNDYRVLCEILGAYDEDGNETTGMGAFVEVIEITDHRPEILTYIENSIDDYSFTHDTGTINNNPTPEQRDFITTEDYDSPDSTENLIDRILEILERVA